MTENWHPTDSCPHCGKDMLDVFNDLISEQPDEFQYDCECGRTLTVKVIWIPEYIVKEE
jgi:lysyl-tRNA synthetase class I